jgi:hypothetical protein
LQPFPVKLPDFPVWHLPFPCQLPNFPVRFPAFPVARTPFPLPRTAFPPGWTPFPVKMTCVPVLRTPFPHGRNWFPVGRSQFPELPVPLPPDGAALPLRFRSLQSDGFGLFIVRQATKDFLKAHFAKLFLFLALALLPSVGEFQPDAAVFHPAARGGGFIF